ncbi:hypothetical protein DFR68_13119 [Nocardia mexicana]|uniref:Uncharacterized protein n=1 Tax=Nocardia mexicana TaxID=279262 RepID=A0A370GEQ0_9NOCA|nr:hypothetical protein DFR68_13119 [Nocardia mexicana]
MMGWQFAVDEEAGMTEPRNNPATAVATAERVEVRS